MLSEERYASILSAVRENGSVTIADLADLLAISESTVRRDLAELDRQGRLKKVHGGAIACHREIQLKEPKVSEKQKLFSAEKDRIAQCAAALIKENDFVFIDAGTTTEKMIKYIGARGAVFVTNAFHHAHLLAEQGLRVYLVGGDVKSRTEAIVGTFCVEMLKKFNFTKCFLGTNGIGVRQGFTTPDVDEAGVKRAAAEQAQEVFVLADHSKFGGTAAITFLKLTDACIITDRLYDKKYKTLTTVKEVHK